MYSFVGFQVTFVLECLAAQFAIEIKESALMKLHVIGETASLLEFSRAAFERTFVHSDTRMYIFDMSV